MPEQLDPALPTHPRTGLTALGIVNGRPVWPILGASDDHVDEDDHEDDDTADAADTTSGEDAAAAGEDGDKPLGAAGEKALHAEKEKRRAAQRELREWKALGLTPEQIRAIQAQKGTGAGDAGDQAAPDVEAIREQARAEARAEAMKDKALDKIEAKAARLFKNPDDARRFLGDRVSDFIDGSTVDVEAITDALGELLKERPYLGAQGDGDGRPKFSGTGDSGPRNGTKPGQVTEDELKRMSPEQIVKARSEGRLRELLGGK